MESLEIMKLRVIYFIKVEDIFGEPSDKGIQTLFSEFYSSYQELAKTPDKSAARTVAVQKASALANALNNTYTQLEKAVYRCSRTIAN